MSRKKEAPVGRLQLVLVMGKNLFWWRMSHSRSSVEFVVSWQLDSIAKKVDIHLLRFGISVKQTYNLPLYGSRLSSASNVCKKAAVVRSLLSLLCLGRATTVQRVFSEGSF